MRKITLLYKSEGEFRLELKKFLESRHWQVQIIEVGIINRGVPDLYICKNGHEHWLELKNSRSSFTSHWIIDFRPGQQSWLRRNKVHGGRPFVIEAGDRQYAIHKYNEVIKDNTLVNDYEVVNGLERIAYLLEVS
jgi:hypothetical protein